MHHRNGGRAEGAVEPLGIAKARGKFAQPRTGTTRGRPLSIAIYGLAGRGLPKMRAAEPPCN
jgi:hypothetical protein